MAETLHMDDLHAALRAARAYALAARESVRAKVTALRLEQLADAAGEAEAQRRGRVELGA